MNLWWTVAAAGAALFLLLRRGRVFLHMRYQRRGAEDCLTLEVRLFDVIRVYRREARRAVWRAARKLLFGGKAEKARRARGAAARPDRTGRWQALGRLLAESVCTKLEARVKLATPDAALTGLLCGAAHAAAALALQSAARRIRFAAAPRVAISADFERKTPEIELHCIFAARLGNLIGIFMSISKAIGRQKR